MHSSAAQGKEHILLGSASRTVVVVFVVAVQCPPCLRQHHVHLTRHSETPAVLHCFTLRSMLTKTRGPLMLVICWQISLDKGEVWQCHSLMHGIIGVFLWTDAQVAVFVEVHSQRIPISHEKPLSNVELAAVNEQRLLWKIAAQDNWQWGCLKSNNQFSEWVENFLGIQPHKKQGSVAYRCTFAARSSQRLFQILCIWQGHWLYCRIQFLKHKLTVWDGVRGAHGSLILRTKLSQSSAF